MQNIKIYLDNPTLLHSGGIGFLSAQVKDSPWYQAIQASGMKETIRMRSLIKKETETAKIIHNMAKLFRSSLTWSNDKIT